MHSIDISRINPTDKILFFYPHQRIISAVKFKNPIIQEIFGEFFNGKHSINRIDALK